RRIRRRAVRPRVAGRRGTPGGAGSGLRMGDAPAGAAGRTAASVAADADPPPAGDPVPGHRLAVRAVDHEEDGALVRGRGLVAVVAVAVLVGGGLAVRSVRPRALDAAAP